MPPLQKRDGDPRKFYGTRLIERYSLEQLYEETAFIAYHFHWPEAEVLEMPHGERIQWCREITRINRRLNREPENIFEHPQAFPTSSA